MCRPWPSSCAAAWPPRLRPCGWRERSRSTRSTSWPGTRGSPPRWRKGALGTAPQAGGRARPRHAGEGQAAGPRPDPARRAAGPPHAGRCAAADHPADHRGRRRRGPPRPHRRVRRLRPPAGLGLPARDGLPRAWGVRARRGRRRLLRGPRQHDGRDLVAAALLAAPAPGHLAGQAAALPRLLRVRAQRPPSRQSLAWRPRRGSGRVTKVTKEPSPRIPTRATDVWFEITTLLIPGENDSEAEVEALSGWVAERLGPDVPLHFTAFHPDWKMRDTPPTPPATLRTARRIARE